MHVVVASATPILGDALAQPLSAAGHELSYARSAGELRALLCAECGRTARMWPSRPWQPTTSTEAGARP